MKFSQIRRSNVGARNRPSRRIRVAAPNFALMLTIAVRRKLSLYRLARSRCRGLPGPNGLVGRRQVITQLAPRNVRRLCRRWLHEHRETINTVLIALVFMLAGVLVTMKLMP